MGGLGLMCGLRYVGMDARTGNKITFASHLTDDEDEPEVQAPAALEA